MRTIGTVSVLPVTVFLALGCNDRDGGRTPTDPGLDVRNAQASFSHDGNGRGNDGSGSQFKLFGKARITRDPENRSNVVLEVVSDPTFAGAGAYRDLRNVQLWQLDHQLNFKWAFVPPHTCGGGSPRIALLIDADGDGKFRQAPGGPDFAAHGHIQPLAGCPATAPTGSRQGASPSTLTWGWSDLTDEMPRWEITPGGLIAGLPAFPYAPWDLFEQVVSAAFPKHQVLRGIFLEDFNPTPGLAYYDLITIFDLTLGTRGQWQPERGDRDDDSDDHDN